MDRSWARDYAERWGLPQPALNELVGALREQQRYNDEASRAPTQESARAPARATGASADFPPRRDDYGTDPVGVSGRGWPSPAPAGDEPSWAVSGDFGSRYEEMGMIGEGGMGEVRRMWDLALHRSVAMKILRRDLADREDLVLRFVEEAQATAQLEHPGIVPVYEIGRLPDGRPYFTMKEIRGRSLLDVIEEVHAASSDGGSWGTSPAGWTFHRLIGVFNQVCEAVAYAHSRGVLHRDLKPTNVMVGGFGEVVVMDWGLAKIGSVTGTTGGGTTLTGAGNVVTARSRGGLYQTRSGSVAGTPNYMPPEQARGDHARIGPWSDVYSLGALLYEMLADRAPYEGDDLDSVVQAVLAGPPPSPAPRWQHTHRRMDENHPEEVLRAICARAMARDLADRFMDAGTLREAVSAWLERAGAREGAVNLVRTADGLNPEIQALRSKVHTLRADAERRLTSLPREAPMEEKRAAWALEDQARDYERQLTQRETQYKDLLKAALASVPNLPEAVNRLEAVRDPSVPAAGEGELRLATDPPATAYLSRVDTVDRRLVPVTTRTGPGPLPTPIDGIALPAGTWQIELHAEGHMPLRLLARIVAGERWTTGPTPAGKPLKLARAGEDPPDAIRVPQGFFACGGDRESADALPASRAWVGPFLVTRFPITVAQFLVFLDSVPDADSHAPPDVLRDAGGRFTAPVGWRLEQPMRRVSFEAASAYAEWLSARTGRYWRLPRELEWEKAARGVDGRTYPWGDFLDTSWCAVFDGQAEPRPAPVDAYPLDVSPYGVRGLGGNVRDWVIDERSPRRPHGQGHVAAEHRLVKGGHYLGVAQFARCALRYRVPAPFDDTVGFRLVSPLEGA